MRWSREKGNLRVFHKWKMASLASRETPGDVFVGKMPSRRKGVNEQENIITIDNNTLKGYLVMSNGAVHGLVGVP